MKEAILMGLMAVGLPTYASAKPDCASDAMRKVALDFADREVGPGFPLSNITTAKTIKRTGNGVVCEVVVMWADKEWERYRVTVQKTGIVP